MWWTRPAPPTRLSSLSAAAGSPLRAQLSTSGRQISGCQISGSGLVTIHGKFVEREAPGISGATQLLVSAGGSLTGAVEQPPEYTRFAFEPGCVLRMKIHQHKNGGGGNSDRPARAGRQR